MNLYLISQTVNDDYDSYDSAVVCCGNADIARNMHPFDGTPVKWGTEEERWNGWAAKLEDVTVTFIGIADPFIKEGVVCASFNAG